MSHPRVDGREPELRRLVDGVRDLNEMINNHLATAVETAALAAAVRSIVESLEPRDRPFENRFGSGASGEPRDIFPFDVMLGPYNPIAPHVDVSYRDETAYGEVVFGKSYEGPPGCCHGGVLAAAFDQVFNIANIVGGVPGMTAELSINYRKPTRLHVPTTFRAWIDRTDGRKVMTRAVCEQGGEVTCDAEGLFVTRSFGD